VWREDLEPGGVVAARTVPVLQSEVTRMRKALSAVRPSFGQISESSRAYADLDGRGKCTTASTGPS